MITEKGKLNTATFITILALLLFLGGIFYATAVILKPFYESIFIAGVITIAVHPLKILLLKFLKGKKTLTSVIIMIVIAGLIAGVLLPISFSLFRESKNLYIKVKDKVSTTDSEWREKAEKVADTFLKFDSERIYEIVLGFADKMKNLSRTIVSWITSIMRGTFKFIFDAFMFFLFLFYFIRDGDEIIKSIFRYIPLEDKLKSKTQDNLYRTTFAVITGIFLTAIAQGILAGTGFFIAGVPYPSLLGLLTSVCSLIPVGGAALVWAPVTIGLLINKAFWSAIFLAIWGMLIVSTVDNIIKPLIIGKDIRLPFLWMFVFIIGGLKVFGFTGIFIGPIIYSLLKVAGDTVREYTYFQKKDEARKEGI